MGRVSIAERFWSKVAEAPADACWIWLGQKNLHGYGQFWNGQLTVRAHRWSYEHMRAEIAPYGLPLDHLCNVRACVNPFHLEPVSWGVNMRRGVERGTFRPGHPNLALHADRHAPPPPQSRACVYRRRADALAAEIDSGVRPPGSLIRYQSGGGGNSNPDARAIELLELWGLVRRLPSQGRLSLAAAAVTAEIPTGSPAGSSGP